MRKWLDRGWGGPAVHPGVLLSYFDAKGTRFVNFLKKYAVVPGSAMAGRRMRGHG